MISGVHLGQPEDGRRFTQLRCPDASQLPGRRMQRGCLAVGASLGELSKHGTQAKGLVVGMRHDDQRPSPIRQAITDRRCAALDASGRCGQSAHRPLRKMPRRLVRWLPTDAGHSHLLCAGTRARTCSTCRPHPDHVVLPQSRHGIAEHTLQAPGQFSWVWLTQARQQDHNTVGGIDDLMGVESAASQDVIRRLRYVEAQIGGVIWMLEQGPDCTDIVTELAAASHALHRAGVKLVSSDTRQCVTPTAVGAPTAMTVDQMEKLFLSLA
jgi:DNA-binding FrmR family transcriptional regulator